MSSEFRKGDRVVIRPAIGPAWYGVVASDQVMPDNVNVIKDGLITAYGQNPSFTFLVDAADAPPVPKPKRNVKAKKGKK
jgi:hypothetical protein